jgi:hypothetical protein
MDYFADRNLYEPYEFDCINDYFEYIIDSRSNGQNTQAKNLWKAMDAEQKGRFSEWAAEYLYFEDLDTRTNDDGDEVSYMDELLAFLRS